MSHKKNRPNRETPVVNPHPSLAEKLRPLSYRDAHKYLRGFGCTKSERYQILRMLGFKEGESKTMIAKEAT